MEAAIHPQLAWTIDWINQYPVTTSMLIFGTAFLESLFIIGTLVPGAILIIAFGALIALGHLDMTSTVLLCIAGAITGDGLSYWLGYHYKTQIKKIWPFKHFNKQLQAGEKFFERHGGKSVAMGRFVGPIRAVIPTIAGMMGMSPMRFTIINILSAIAWAPAYLLPGVVFGASLELASEVAIRLVVLIFGIIFFILILRWLLRKILNFIQPRATAINHSTLQWARRHKVLGPAVQSLVDPRHPESSALLFFAFILIISGTVFFYVSSSLSLHGSLLDQRIYDLMQSLRTPWIDQFMVWVTMLGDVFVITSVSLIVITWLLIKRNVPAALHFGAAILFGAILTRILKVSLQVSRPDTSLFTEASFYSFPSSHSTMAMVVYGFLAIIICREIRPARRLSIYVGAGLLISMIAISRLYLGAHWFSDVIGGLSLGLIWITLLGIAYRQHHSTALSARTIIIISALALILSASLHSRLHFDREFNRYTHNNTQQISPLKNWPEQNWKKLASYRNDLAHSSAYPFNVQWAGTLQQIEKTLQQHNWQTAPRLNSSNIIKWLSNQIPLKERPILPHVHNDKHESLAMTYFDRQQNKYWVIRFWPSRYKTQQKTIWLGEIAPMQSKSLLGVFHYPVTQQSFTEPLTLLKRQLSNQIHKAETRVASNDKKINWNGEVLLIK